MRLLRQLALLTAVSVINIVVVLCIVDPQPSSAGPTISAGDANGDSTVDIADAVYVLSYLFQGGTAPVAIAQTGLTAEQEEILSHMSIEYLDDGVGGLRKTIRFTAVNLQVVNGLGATNGNPGSPFSVAGIGDWSAIAKNGLGNLIIGYDEQYYPAEPVVKDGSHNLVVGAFHGYPHISGVVAGYHCEIRGQYNSAFGNHHDTGLGHNTHIFGGSSNSISGMNTSILGGSQNTASGNFGGVMVGGVGNTCIGAVPGPGAYPTIVGGENCSVSGRAATVTGGYQRSVNGDHDWRAGSLFEDQ